MSSWEQSDVDEWRREEGIVVSGAAPAAPRPVRTFAVSQLPKYVLDECRAAGYERPTSVQAQVWPCLLSGRDAVVVAKTGSGKTLAYALPALVHIMNQPLLESGDGPIALALCPTRELAVQIDAEAERYFAPCRLRCRAVYGGVPKAEQAAALARGVEMVVATPGRLLDLVDGGQTSLLRVTYVVLDEADRMLSLGFGQYVARIECLIRPDRQAVLLTATMPAEVAGLAKSFLSKPQAQAAGGGRAAEACGPLTVRVGTTDEGGIARCASVAQRVRVVADDAEKLRLLTAELRRLRRPGEQALVFCNTKARVDEVAAALRGGALRREGGGDGGEEEPVEGMHGGHDMERRTDVLERYREGRFGVLVATGVLGRGIDLPGVTHVFSYDFPHTFEEYVHRIGRTARGVDGTGVSVSYVTYESYGLVPELVEYLELCGAEVPDALAAMLPAGRKRRAEKEESGGGGSAAKRARLLFSSVASAYSPEAAGGGGGGAAGELGSGVGPAVTAALRRSGTAPPVPQAAAAAAAEEATTRVAFSSTNPSNVLLLRNVVAPGYVPHFPVHIFFSSPHTKTHTHTHTHTHTPHAQEGR